MKRKPLTFHEILVVFHDAILISGFMKYSPHTLPGTNISYLENKENHRLKSTFKRGYGIVSRRVFSVGFHPLNNDQRGPFFQQLIPFPALKLPNLQRHLSHLSVAVHLASLDAFHYLGDCDIALPWVENGSWFVFSRFLDIPRCFC